MKRFALLLGVFVLSIPPVGCGTDGSGGGGDTAKYSRADDPTLPKEVREYEAKTAKRLEERGVKTSAGKAAAQPAPK